MSKLQDVILSGSFGNLVFYRRMGKDLVRTKRTSIQQSDSTKKRGINFGIASKAGRGLRVGLQAVMPLPTDRSTQSRISGAISKWLGQTDINNLNPEEDVPYIGSLEFVEGKGFFTRFKVPMEISHPQENLIRVKIESFVPAKDIAAPAKTVSVKMILSVSGCVLPTGEHTNHETHSIEIPFTDEVIPAMEFDFHIEMPHKSLTITAGRLMFYQSKGQALSEIESPAFMAAGVVNAKYS